MFALWNACLYSPRCRWEENTSTESHKCGPKRKMNQQAQTNGQSHLCLRWKVPIWRVWLPAFTVNWWSQNCICHVNAQKLHQQIIHHRRRHIGYKAAKYRTYGRRFRVLSRWIIRNQVSQRHRSRISLDFLLCSLNTPIICCAIHLSVRTSRLQSLPSP